MRTTNRTEFTVPVINATKNTKSSENFHQPTKFVAKTNYQNSYFDYGPTKYFRAKRPEAPYRGTE